MEKTGRTSVDGRVEKRSTIGDVARRAGVSAATVSRVVNGVYDKASAKTVARVQAAVDDLKYRPGSIGRALRKQESRLVPFLVPDVSNAFYSAIAVSVEAALRDREYAMILCNTAEDPVRQDVYLTEMSSHLVPGIAMMGAVESPGLRAMVEGGETLVFVDRRSPYPGAQPFVGIDNFNAGRDVAHYMADHGLDRCGMICGPEASAASRDRRAGYLSGLAERQISPEDAHLVKGGLTVEDGYRSATELFSRNPQPRAVFCVNDLVAYGARKRCSELGLDVPGDVVLFGIDDNPLNEWVAPWLSTVHVPADAIGEAVGRILVEIWDGRTMSDIPDAILPYRMVLRGE